MTEEDKRPLPHEAIIGLVKEAQKDFREMIGELKKFNENIEAAMLYMGGAFEEKEKRVEENGEE